MYVVVVQKFTFVISSPDEFLLFLVLLILMGFLVSCSRLNWLAVSIWEHVG